MSSNPAKCKCNAKRDASGKVGWLVRSPNTLFVTLFRSPVIIRVGKEFNGKVSVRPQLFSARALVRSTSRRWSP